MSLLRAFYHILLIPSTPTVITSSSPPARKTTTDLQGRVEEKGLTDRKLLPAVGAGDSQVGSPYCRRIPQAQDALYILCTIISAIAILSVDARRVLWKRFGGMP